MVPLYVDVEYISIQSTFHDSEFDWCKYYIQHIELLYFQLL